MYWSHTPYDVKDHAEYCEVDSRMRREYLHDFAILNFYLLIDEVQKRRLYWGWHVTSGRPSEYDTYFPRNQLKRPRDGARA